MKAQQVSWALVDPSFPPEVGALDLRTFVKVEFFISFQTLMRPLWMLLIKPLDEPFR